MSDDGVGIVVQLVRRVLGDGVLGIYRHGSATLGGLRPDSDLDVLVVVRERLTDHQRQELTGDLLKISGRDGRRYVELAVVVQSDVRPWRHPPVCDFLYGDWLRADFERGAVPAREPSPDLAPLLTMTLLAGTPPLQGPPPADVLDPVPHEDLLRGITAGIPELMADIEHDTRNVLLTLARIWTTVVTGTVRSKDAAADWVLPRLPEPHRPALTLARDAYLGRTADDWTDRLPQARACAEHIRLAVATASAAPDRGVPERS